MVTQRLREMWFLNSGDYTKVISVVASNNSTCYEALDGAGVNLIPDPLMTDISAFGGWGTRSINNDPRYAYCGVSSGKVSGSGSITNDLTGQLKPNTTYRVKAKVFRKNPGNVTYTLAVDKDANPTEYNLIKTAMDSACYYFNRYTPFNTNIYVYYNSGIPTAQASYYGSIGFGSNTRYMWVGTAIHEMDHFFGSGTTTAWQSNVVNGKWQGAAANALIKEITNGATTTVSGDSQHFWPYGINQREEITNMGGLAVQEKALADAVRLAKAMLVDDTQLVSDFNEVGVGVYGWSGTSSDIYHKVTTLEEWEDVDFTFTTGETLGNQQGVYFNSGSGFIDNWEMYELSATAIDDQTTNGAENIAFVGDNLEVSFTLNGASDVSRYHLRYTRKTDEAVQF